MALPLVTEHSGTVQGAASLTPFNPAISAWYDNPVKTQRYVKRGDRVMLESPTFAFGGGHKNAREGRLFLPFVRCCISSCFFTLL